MKRSSSFIKRKIALFIVLLLSIESFAAVVGDNDGAAFITKAEFDSLKNNFQSQLDRYNSSVDSKIDGAIASYLSGIKVHKEQNLNVLVKNYNAITWVNNWQIYGVWRKWIGVDTKNEQTTNGWYVPSMNEKRINLRNGNNLTIYESGVSADGCLQVAYDLKPVGLYDGVTIGKRNFYESAGGISIPPVTVIKLVEGVDRKWYPDTNTPLMNIATLLNAQYCNVHNMSFSNISGGAEGYLFRERPARIAADQADPVYFQTPTGDALWDAQMIIWQGADRLGRARFTPVAADFNWPQIYTQQSLFSSQGFAENTRGLLTDAIAAMTHGYIERGNTFNVGDASTGTIQQNLFLNMFLGADSDILCNAAYRKTSAKWAEVYDCSTATNSCIVEATLAWANAVTPAVLDVLNTDYHGNSRFVPTSSVPVTLNLPLWPTLALKDVNSNYIKYKNQPMQIGQGLPIVEDLNANGTLHISAEYTTDRIISSYTQKGITIDIADRPFNETNRKFYNGYEGNVDPENTIVPQVALQSYVIDNVAKKIELTVPVKKDNDVWLRIAPNTSDGGYYARLSNLKVTFVTE
ncbi:MAG: hypothetical protein J6O09_01010 [Lachnospiraceae bacterium]|nr:hypothetical protein [Lachnospiraceae bacterium]